MEKFTEAQATDEAILLFMRKLKRQGTGAYRETLIRLPEGARRALEAAERRADVHRGARTSEEIVAMWDEMWPEPQDDDELSDADQE